MSEIIVLGMTLIWIVIMIRALFKGQFSTNTLSFNWGAIASYASGAGDAIWGSVAAKKGARRQEQSYEQAMKAGLEEEDEAYKLEQEKLAPWEEFGTKARMSFQDLLGYNGPDAQVAAMEALRSSPAYQFRQKEAMNQVQGSAAGKGALKSGRTLMALQNRGQELASTEYDKEYARRAGLAQGAYGISTDVANRGATHYRNRGDIRSGFYKDQGDIKARKFQNIREVQKNAANLATSGSQGWGGGGGGGGNNPYDTGSSGYYYNTNKRNTSIPQSGGGYRWY